jgi:outer membrane biosynthesis protein TonB
MRKLRMDQDLREATRVKRAEAAAVPAPAVQAARTIEMPMVYWRDAPRDQHEYVKVRTLWVTVTLSLLVHVLMLSLVLERTRLLAPFDEGTKQGSEQLQVRLTAPPRPLPPTPAPEPPREIVAMPKPAHAPRPAAPRQPPPVALTTPARSLPAPTLPAPTPTPPTPAPPRPPAEGDLWSYLQARRRERGESEAAVTAPKSDPNASLAANLPTAATGVATPDPNKGGGIFEIKSMNYDDAEFLFFGWNREMGRRTPQLIEVRRGNNPDVQIAVVRKMISIIREYSKEDFVWRSHNRDITLSARLEDNAALEAFLMHDFGFDQAGPNAAPR